MRQAGTLITKEDAERFANYLLSLGISSKVEPAADAWAIWIHDENAIPRSRQELEQFQHNPADRRYADAERVARQVRRETAAKQRQAQRNYIDMRNEWARPLRRRPVTVVLMAASVLAYLLRDSEVRPYDYLAFFWPAIREGQVWRLVTPIFMHFGLLHILFNVWWLYDLGTVIERKLNSFWFAVLILAIAVPSNAAQYVATGPGFGGMSGVVFGLFGYAWVRGRLDPTCGLYLRPDVAFWMMAWFALCLTGAVGSIANWAHGVGLAMGVALGWLTHEMARLRRKS